jgi:hypothetical protein
VTERNLMNTKKYTRWENGQRTYGPRRLPKVMPGIRVAPINALSDLELNALGIFEHIETATPEGYVVINKTIYLDSANNVSKEEIRTVKRSNLPVNFVNRPAILDISQKIKDVFVNAGISDPPARWDDTITTLKSLSQEIAIPASIEILALRTALIEAGGTWDDVVRQTVPPVE